MEWGFIPEHFFNPMLIEGAKMTILLSVLAQALGVTLGLVSALMKLSKNRVLNVISAFYVWLFRGTPLLVQLIVFATGLYQVGIELSLFTAALLAFSLNEGAYMSEIVRAGIQSIDPGQSEASKALGMTYGQSMRRIILPQAARVILPPTGNEFNNMLKSTSLASVIAIKELLQSADDLNHLYFRTLETFTIVSCYYLAMTTVVTWLQTWMESRLGERKSRSGGGGFWNKVRMNVFSRRGAISDHR
ncbi:MAG: amino acid ABC transporter permease [Chloroflexota bacterium]|nr:amino acid ABC transporter permease [Chloroflexota bacterium]MDQ5867378.1 amino acid ABC transporter permease [Chloroflexota bacterium]